MKFFFKLFVLWYITSTALLAAPIIFIAPEQIEAGGYTLSKPGLYVLTDDASAVTNETAIAIASDNVILDLNGKALVGAGVGKRAVKFIGERKNILIKNGTLSEFSSGGIEVSSGSKDLKFVNLSITGSNSFVGSGTAGFVLHGSKDAPIYNCTIEDCHTSSFERGVYALHSHEVSIVNSTFNFNGIGLMTDFSNNWRVINSQASHGFGNVFDTRFDIASAGIACVDGEGWSIEDSDFSFNSSSMSSGGSYGALFTTHDRLNGTHKMTRCSFSNNGNDTGFTRGLDLINASSCVVQDCVFNGNFSTSHSSRGMSVAGVGNYIKNCIADGNYAETMEPFAATGIVVNGSAHTIAECHVAGNVSAHGSGMGILILAAAERCLVRNCTAVSNSLAGFKDDSGSNLLIGNLSWGHGANNYIGEGLGAVSFVAGTQPAAGTFDERGMDNISVI